MHFPLAISLLLPSFLACAQDFRFTPATVLQGQTLTVHAPKEAAKARMHGVTIPLFPATLGGVYGLMPVGVEDTPADEKLEFLDVSGAVLHESTVPVQDAHYSKQNIVIAPEISQLHASSDEAATVKAFLTAASDTRFWDEPLRAPVAGCMNSTFGSSRLHNGKPTGDYHGGVDQRGAPGTPIHATAAGIVRIARMFPLRGGTVAIDHGQGLGTIYMHQSRIAAKEGEEVKAGDVIGYVGSTGRATGPHLHWSLYANGHPVSPLQWVKLTPCGTAAPVRKKKPAPKKKQ
jgi:murein DD-endopeptidase MepM/ murein hydrolase activator NlpD